MRSTLQVVGAAVGTHASIAIALPDAIGRLRVVARSGDDGHGGRLRSARRREAFGSGRLIQVSPGHTPDSRLAIIPLVADGRSLGVVEVLGPSSAVEARLTRVSAAVDRCAARLASSGRDAAREPSPSGSADVIEVASALFRARTKAQAVARTVEECGERLGRPIAGLLPDRSGPGWFLAATGGLGKRKAAQLRAGINDRELPYRGRGSEARLGEIFCSVLGVDRCETIKAGPAVLLTLPLAHGHERYMLAVARLLQEALRDDPHGSRDLGVLDVGIGWTAHEIRTPVLSARSVIEQVIEDPENGQNHQLLVRASSELGFIADLVEPLLYWAAGSGRLRRRRIDLVRLVREVVDSSIGQREDGRISIQAPQRLPARADGGQLRCAIANLVRNALAYSPPDDPVSVIVRAEGDEARICVRDRGPGVPPGERDEIFQPFARGRAASGRGGHGLGLFITKRIVEAHGGSITFGSQAGTTSFCIRLPVDGRDLRWTS